MAGRITIDRMVRIHGTCVAIGDTGVLLRGISGSGKSDLALRLIDEGAALVADDHVEVTLEGPGLLARAPATIAGMIEVRGLGLFRLPYCDAPLALLFDMTPGQAVERLPDPDAETILGVTIPRHRLNPWEGSAAAKVRLAVAAAKGSVGLLS